VTGTVSYDFAGASVLVTGAARGIGRDIAATFAAAGARVVLSDVAGLVEALGYDTAGPDELEQAAEAIRAAGGEAVAVPADVRDEGAVARLVDETVAAHGSLDVLVNNAGVFVGGPTVADTTEEQWDAAIDVNLKGPFLCMRAGIPAMVEAGGGSVIALGSTLGLIVAPGYPAYCASKGALVNLCKQVAIEHAGDGVRVNVVAPSAHEAGLFMKMTEQAPDPEGLRRRIAAAVPMKRLGRVDDVCQTVLFLASDASSYISGAVIPLDGGLAARRM